MADTVAKVSKRWAMIKRTFCDCGLESAFGGKADITI
jgi:hypothetical protein